MKNELRINVVLTDDGTDIYGTCNGKDIDMNIGARFVAGVLADVSTQMLQKIDKQAPKEN